MFMFPLKNLACKGLKINWIIGSDNVSSRHQFGAKQLAKPMLTYQLDFLVQIPVQLDS